MSQTFADRNFIEHDFCSLKDMISKYSDHPYEERDRYTLICMDIHPYVSNKTGKLVEGAKTFSHILTSKLEDFINSRAEIARCYYEVEIGAEHIIDEKNKRKLKFDLDMARSDYEDKFDSIDQEKLIMSLIEQIEKSFSELYRRPLSRELIYICNNSVADKISYHLVIGGYKVIDHEQGKNFAMHVKRNWNSEFSSAIDESVYGIFRPFRLCRCHKLGKKSIKGEPYHYYRQYENSTEWSEFSKRPAGNFCCSVVTNIKDCDLLPELEITIPIRKPRSTRILTDEELERVDKMMTIYEEKFSDRYKGEKSRVDDSVFLICQDEECFACDGHKHTDNNLVVSCDYLGNVWERCWKYEGGDKEKGRRFLFNMTDENREAPILHKRLLQIPENREKSGKDEAKYENREAPILHKRLLQIPENREKSGKDEAKYENREAPILHKILFRFPANREKSGKDEAKYENREKSGKDEAKYENPYFLKDEQGLAELASEKLNKIIKYTWKNGDRNIGYKWNQNSLLWQEIDNKEQLSKMIRNTIYPDIEAEINKVAHIISNDKGDEDKNCKRYMKTLKSLEKKMNTAHGQINICRLTCEMLRDNEFKKNLDNVKSEILSIRGGKAYNMRTGELRERNMEDKFSFELECAISETTERATKYMKEMLNEKWVRINKIMGYCWTPQMREKKVYIAIGPSDTGKSTFLKLSTKNMSKRAKTLNEVAIFEGRETNHNEAFIYAISNSTLMTYTETKPGQRFNEKAIKDIAGGDNLALRGCGDRIEGEIDPCAKLIIATNHHPETSGQDSLLNKLDYMVFDHVFEKTNETKKTVDNLMNDRKFLDQLFTLQMQGAKEYYENSEISEDTEGKEEYQGKNPVTLWLEEECERGNDDEKNQYRYPVSVAKENFMSWMRTQDSVISINATDFGKVMSKIFDKKAAKIGVKTTKCFMGVRAK